MNKKNNGEAFASPKSSTAATRLTKRAANTARQAGRRALEKEFLTSEGYNSWERVHTLLVHHFLSLKEEREIPPMYRKKGQSK